MPGLKEANEFLNEAKAFPTSSVTRRFGQNFAKVLKKVAKKVAKAFLATKRYF